MFRLPKNILGINKRNIDYIFKYNRRKDYPLVDDKVQTKALAQAAGLKTPDLLGVIHKQHNIRNILGKLSGENGFVIKPAQGAGGGGILVINKVQSHYFFKAEGRPLDLDDITYHIGNILAGMYSLGGNRDHAMIENRIICHESFKKISYKGVPDIRIILFHGEPVMAMLRLPTQESDGKANLHSGGIGVGIDLKTGQTTHAIQHNIFIQDHPDNLASLTNIQIPNWDNLLKEVSCFAKTLPLKYLGLDMVLDDKGQYLLLEANARPGISIQIANRMGLCDKLKSIEAKISV